MMAAGVGGMTDFELAMALQKKEIATPRRMNTTSTPTRHKSRSPERDDSCCLQ